MIQLEFASNVVTHLHRIGRAARAGRTGRATHMHDSDAAALVAVVRAGDGAGEGAGRRGGDVSAAFSRKRGFRAKQKKAQRNAKTSGSAAYVRADGRVSEADRAAFRQLRREERKRGREWQADAA